MTEGLQSAALGARHELQFPQGQSQLCSLCSHPVQPLAAQANSDTLQEYLKLLNCHVFSVLLIVV